MPENPKYEILLKEIDLIHDTIKNFDDIMFKTKNFGLAIWGGSLYLIVEHLTNNPSKPLLVLFSSIIPLVFWLIHARWQVHLFSIGGRSKVISTFINSNDFQEWRAGSGKVTFPVYDVVGWIYTNKSEHGKNYDPAYLTKPASLMEAIFYKDAKYFFGPMILVSIVLGLILLKTPDVVKGIT